ncbi:MAG: FtsW/RodA/SpoVE family cell cycle protein [Eubacterium sp.]|nr:FtsW/RodA/SpoVE family cell cycle protein [Eubacterium sp.]
MTTIITEVSKYLMIILFACYTYDCFYALQKSRFAERQKAILRRQRMYLFLIHLDAYLVIFANTKELKMLVFYLMQVLLLGAIWVIYRYLYKKAARLVTNNLCMLLVISFIILTRLNPDKAIRQFSLALVAVLLTLVVPFFIRHIHFLHKLPYLYALIGIVLLLLVAVAGNTAYGAKLSFTFGSVRLQPSEFIKILFVFFVAAMFYHSIEFKQIVITSVLAALHVLILVLSKDLGSASIFFVTYLVMLYVATKDYRYLLLGALAGSGAAVIAYQLFSHVKVRVMAWKNPLAVIDNQGYQISQSLFAIGTGGWFGLGLYQGMPNKIPVADEDFVFAAICEELGGVFAVCLILVCASCYLMFLNIAMQMRDRFYKLLALGLGTVYGFQVFLTIGGVIKFIPSTGVTLPFVSYGGSSLLSTFIIFAVIQGLYIIREDELFDEKKKQEYQQKENRIEFTERTDSTAGTTKRKKKKTRFE